MQFFPATVFRSLAGQAIELRGLDAVHDLDRFARSRNVVEPTTRSNSMIVEFQNAQGKRIAAAKIVEQPAVELRRHQRSLDFIDPFRGRWCSAHFRSNQKQRERVCECEYEWLHRGPKLEAGKMVGNSGGNLTI